MKLHYNTFIALVLFGLIFEGIVAIIWYNSGDVDITFQKYILKYLLAPLFVNLIFVLISIFVIRSSKLSQKVKAYTISLLYVGVSIIFYTVHSLFYTLFIIFTIPILLTVIYNDYILTTVTAILSFSLMTISDFFIVWDPDKLSPLDSDLGLVNFSIAMLLLLLFYLLCIVAIRFGKEKNAASIQKEIEHYQTRQKLKIDDLTNIFNRVVLREAFQNMEEDISGKVYYFAMLDIDDFKKLNDTVGHEKGDRCLIEFAKILSKHCSDDVQVFRFGGDEFCILFKNTTLDSVVETCSRIQQDFKTGVTSTNSMMMSASIGISKYEKHLSATQLLENTDSALYRSKADKDFIHIFVENNDYKKRSFLFNNADNFSGSV